MKDNGQHKKELQKIHKQLLEIRARIKEMNWTNAGNLTDNLADYVKSRLKRAKKGALKTPEISDIDPYFNDLEGF